jgi:hypothetical protein
MKRRSRRELERQVARAKGRRAKALAFYELGVFHDNNSREAEAIPNDQRALELGLDKAIRPKALAWLASSLFKTGQATEALECVAASRQIADQRLQRFLVGLQDRIERRRQMTG